MADEHLRLELVPQRLHRRAVAHGVLDLREAVHVVERLLEHGAELLAFLHLLRLGRGEHDRDLGRRRARAKAAGQS